MGLRKNLNPGAVMVADTISRLPEDAKEIVQEARKATDKRRREWLRAMKKEFAAANREGRKPMGPPCPSDAIEAERRLPATRAGRHD